MRIFFGLAIVSVVLLSSCSDGEIAEVFDPVKQRKKDIEIITNYINDRNITAYDTTSQGVRYYVESEGTGDIIESNDIVKANYICKTAKGIIIFTNIPEVSDTAVAVSPISVLEPRVFTHSESGWSMEGISFTDNSVELQGRGFFRALGKGLLSTRVGGKLVILLPSDQALGQLTDEFIDPFSVLIYEIYPIEVIK